MLDAAHEVILASLISYEPHKCTCVHFENNTSCANPSSEVCTKLNQKYVPGATMKKQPNNMKKGKCNISSVHVVCTNDISMTSKSKKMMINGRHVHSTVQTKRWHMAPIFYGPPNSSYIKELNIPKSNRQTTSTQWTARAGQRPDA